MHLGTKKSTLVVLAPAFLLLESPQRLRRQAAVDLTELCGGWDVTWPVSPSPAEKGVLLNMQLFAALFDEFGLTIHKPPALGIGNHWPRWNMTFNYVTVRKGEIRKPSGSGVVSGSQVVFLLEWLGHASESSVHTSHILPTLLIYCCASQLPTEPPLLYYGHPGKWKCQSSPSLSCCIKRGLSSEQFLWGNWLASL